MKKPSPAEIALYATIYGGLAVWLGTSFTAEKDNAIKDSQLAKVYCYGDYVGVLGQFKDKWYATENKTRTINGERVKLKENERVNVDFNYCIVNYNLDSKYSVPAGLTRETVNKVSATVIGAEAVGRGFTLTVNVGNGEIRMAQSSFLKQYPYFVKW